MKRVAVVGASGAVGEVMIRLLQERRFPLASIKFLASEQSAGRSIEFAGEAHPIEPLRASAFSDVDIVLSSTPASVSREFSPIAARAGAVVVDNSSAFRMDPERSARRAGSQSPRRRQAPGDHRQPELLDDPDGRRPQAFARCLPDPPGDREHVSIRLGGGPEGARRASIPDQRPRPRTSPFPPPPSSLTRSRSTASPRSTTSSRTATRRRK